jgi:hypothetical protein
VGRTVCPQAFIGIRKKTKIHIALMKSNIAILFNYQLAEKAFKNENERIKIWKVSGTKALFLRRRTVHYRSTIVGKQGWDCRKLLLVSVADRPMDVKKADRLILRTKM